MALGFTLADETRAEYQEVYEVEQFPDYFDHVVPYLQTCELDEYPIRLGTDIDDCNWL